MSVYLDCWISVATALFSQALAGEPSLGETLPRPLIGEVLGYTATLAGDEEGKFTVLLDPAVLDAPLMGEGQDQKAGWNELLREVAEAAVGEMLARTGNKCRVEAFEPSAAAASITRAFELKSAAGSWSVLVRDDVQPRRAESAKSAPAPAPQPAPASPPEFPPAPPMPNPGLELLLDVELEATLRFGCREMPLVEILDLGPGDVVELDRHVNDPVDLIVGDKIVARGDVIVVNGSFGLRVTEVAEPRRRLESIRCLF